MLASLFHLAACPPSHNPRQMPLAVLAALTESLDVASWSLVQVWNVAYLAGPNLDLSPAIQGHPKSGAR